MKRSFKQAQTKLTRREALKIFGLGGSTLLLPDKSEAKSRLSMFASHKEVDIVILGAGTGGMDIASRLRRAAPKANIRIIAPNTTHLYQSGQVYVAAGLYTEYDNKRKTADLLADNVTWLQEKVLRIDPDNNQVMTDKSGTVHYDYLISALGCEYDFSKIKGLEKSDIGKNGITSVYLNDMEKGSAKGAIVSKLWFNAIKREAAQASVTVLFGETDTAIKGENAPLDMLFLCNDMLKGKGPKGGDDLHEKVHFNFCRHKHTLFRIPLTDKVLKKITAESKNISVHYAHTLLEVDTKAKKAFFKTEKGIVAKSYDFLHITPAMQAPKVLSDSPLAFQEGTFKGWMEVNEETLQHPKYSNVFGIGDVLGLDTGKSAAAVREQAIVLQDNIAAHLENKKLPMQYNGYSVAPIKTAYGKILLAEYNKNGLSPTLPFSLKKPQWIWWSIDVHLMRRAYFELILRGMM